MALRFQIDRCTAAEVVGWIDDDGPIHSIDVELDGKWICSVSPSIYRPDLSAAGYGDGKRGFAVSLSSYLECCPGPNRLVLRCNRTIFHEATFSGSAALVAASPEGSDNSAGRLHILEEQVAGLTESLRYEQHRIDAALFAAEGLTHLRDDFLRARATAEYEAAFDKSNPLVSVCIATMDRAELLVERALTSLMAQTYENLQIIVVGDHCTDHTEERLARLKDPRISFVNLPIRGPYPRDDWERWLVGGAAPGNRALQIAQGDFVTHLDEDDTYEPRRIEILLQKIREVRADLVYHRFWWQELDGSWSERGNGRFELGQTGAGLILYHGYLARIPWDAFSYRLGEPGDWNLLRKFKMMRVRTAFVPLLLSHHFHFPRREPVAAEPGGEFLE